jgi:hypothetical protein
MRDTDERSLDDRQRLLSNRRAKLLQVRRDPTNRRQVVTGSLTNQQIALLRRISDGLGLPAYVLRPRNCAQDVELLCLFELVASTSGTLSITSAGNDYLQRVDSDGPRGFIANLRVAHGQDHSITVEHWPQEY